MYIYGIYSGYVCNILITYMEYILDMSVIYNLNAYTWNIHSIFCVYTPPGGWCCGGGQDPIPPDPHSTQYVPMRRATKATAKRIGGWNRE